MSILCRKALPWPNAGASASVVKRTASTDFMRCPSSTMRQPHSAAPRSSDCGAAPRRSSGTGLSSGAGAERRDSFGAFAAWPPRVASGARSTLVLPSMESSSPSPRCSNSTRCPPPVSARSRSRSGAASRHTISYDVSSTSNFTRGTRAAEPPPVPVRGAAAPLPRERRRPVVADFRADSAAAEAEAEGFLAPFTAAFGFRFDAAGASLPSSVSVDELSASSESSLLLLLLDALSAAAAAERPRPRVAGRPRFCFAGATSSTISTSLSPPSSEDSTTVAAAAAAERGRSFTGSPDSSSVTNHS